MATGKNVRYFGYEPNEETFNGLLSMARFFDFPVDIKMCGSEEEVFNRKFDFLFSSPPYFDAERYSDNITQSYNKYPQYDVWMESYWRKTVQNMKYMMDGNSIFAINVGNNRSEKMKKIDRDMNAVIADEGMRLINTMTIITPISPLANKTNEYQTKNEYVYFYKLSV
jgi:hypothetical protein